MISVVIPTIPGREEHLERAVAAYRQHTEDVEIIVETGHDCVGKGWQAGAERARGEFIHLTADDLEPHAGWWQPMADAVERGLCPCPVVLNPDGSLQSAGAVGWELQLAIPEDCAHTGWTTVPFMSREQWSLVDPMLPLHYCTDTWVSVRLGRHGIPTVVRTGSVFTHHNAAPGRGAGMSEHARNIHDRARFYDALDALDREVATC